MVEDVSKLTRSSSSIEVVLTNTCHLQILLRLLDTSGQTQYPAQLFDKLCTDNWHKTILENVPDYCIVLPRVMVSPCTVRVLGLEIETGNRVTRMFTEKHGFSDMSFIRVQLANEDGQRLYFREFSDNLVECFKKTLSSGIMVNGQHYKFFSYSASQIKEGSVWMVKPEAGFTVEAMRKRVGDLTKCRSPAEYSARFGQFFSATIPAQTVQSASSTLLTQVQDRPLRHCVVNDVEVRFRGKVLSHTDGVGLIADDEFHKIVSNYPSCLENPSDVSIIQVRYGGAKGTLVAWNRQTINQITCGTGGRNIDVVLRTSMVKFDAPFDRIEICRIGTRSACYLNRYVIFILVHFGVNENIFVKMQSKMLMDLNGMLKHRDVALRVIPRLAVADVAMKETIIRMLNSGLEPSREPYLLSCLNSIRTHHVYDLTKKARIFVEKGAVLLGAIDETGQLPEGCVFFQVKDKETDQFIIHEGPVMGKLLRWQLIA